VFHGGLVKPLRYDPGITSVMPWAVGCLTRENTQECRAFFTQCRALFVDFFTFSYFFYCS